MSPIRSSSTHLKEPQKMGNMGKKGENEKRNGSKTVSKKTAQMSINEVVLLTVRRQLTHLANH